MFFEGIGEHDFGQAVEFVSYDLLVDRSSGPETCEQLIRDPTQQDGINTDKEPKLTFAVYGIPIKRDPIFEDEFSYGGRFYKKSPTCLCCRKNGRGNHFFFFEALAFLLKSRQCPIQ